MKWDEMVEKAKQGYELVDTEGDFWCWMNGELRWRANDPGEEWCEWDFPPLDSQSFSLHKVPSVTEKSEHQKRKERPMARGLLDYFPDALAEVAHVSLVGNEQHNKDQPIHWSFGKSSDSADCIVRHLADRGTLDYDGLSHTAKVAWRALALLQTELESKDQELHARRQAQRDLAAEGSR